VQKKSQNKYIKNSKGELMKNENDLEYAGFWIIGMEINY
jgi:hypothetical protein